MPSRDRAYAFQGKLFNFFSPTLSGSVGYQTFEDIASDYATGTLA
jgi:hypothetical protein